MCVCFFVCFCLFFRQVDNAALKTKLQTTLANKKRKEAERGHQVHTVNIDFDSSSTGLGVRWEYAPSRIGRVDGQMMIQDYRSPWWCLE